MVEIELTDALRFPRTASSGSLTLQDIQ